MNIKVKKIAAAVLATGVLIGAGATPALAYEGDISNTNSGYTTRDYVASSGNYSGSVFQRTILMDSADGRYVNFYIENNSTAAVTFKINNEVSRSLLPGQYGHISVTMPVASSKNYTFRVDGSNGVNIYYKIAQRNSPTA